MNINAKPLKDKQQTADKIHDLINKYHRDITRFYILDRHGRKCPLHRLKLKAFYDLIKNIPYKRDKKPIEIIARPQHLLSGAFPKLDCKKKTVLLGAYLQMNNYTYRLIGTSNRRSKNIHHIFPQVKINGKWWNLDATYPENKIYQPKYITAMEEL